MTVLSACLSKSGLVLVAGDSGLACISTTRGFLMDVLKQLVEFVSKSISQREVSRLYRDSEGIFFANENTC